MIAEEEAKESEADMVFDMAAPKEILSTFNPEWISSLSGMTKWSDKKDKLVELQEAASTPKLEPGDYSALFEVVKKLAGDSHAGVSQNGIKAISLLAKGLR